MASEEREEEQEQGFTVSDKRMFTQEGERRETESRPAPAPEPPTAEVPRPETVAPETSSPLETSSPPEAAPVAEEGPSASEPPGAEDDISMEFSTYVVMLANTVMMLLGQVPDPNTQQRHLDLPQAKHTIDILIMLREKTQGNLTPEEHNLLDEILPQLQMAYVSISKQVG